MPPPQLRGLRRFDRLEPVHEALTAPGLTAPQASLRRYRGEYEPHAHDHAQVLLGLDGRLELDVAGRGFEVEAGRAMIVPAGVTHGYLAQCEARVWVVDAPACQSLDRIRHLAAPRIMAQAGCDADALLAAIAAAPRAQPRRRVDVDRLAAAIDARPHLPWTNAQLAAWAHLSVPRLHARLLEATALTPQAFVRARRLARAQTLLAAGVTLDAAALQVGYRSASALAFALRRDRGLGARALRAPQGPAGAVLADERCA